MEKNHTKNINNTIVNTQQQNKKDNLTQSEKNWQKVVEIVNKPSPDVDKKPINNFDRKLYELCKIFCKKKPHLNKDFYETFNKTVNDYLKNIMPEISRETQKDPVIQKMIWLYDSKPINSSDFEKHILDNSPTTFESMVDIVEGTPNIGDKILIAIFLFGFSPGFFFCEPSHQRRVFDAVKCYILKFLHNHYLEAQKLLSEQNSKETIPIKNSPIISQTVTELKKTDETHTKEVPMKNDNLDIRPLANQVQSNRITQQAPQQAQHQQCYNPSLHQFRVPKEQTIQESPKKELSQLVSKLDSIKEPQKNKEEINQSTINQSQNLHLSLTQSQIHLSLTQSQIPAQILKKVEEIQDKVIIEDKVMEKQEDSLKKSMIFPKVTQQQLYQPPYQVPQQSQTVNQKQKENDQDQPKSQAPKSQAVDKEQFRQRNAQSRKNNNQDRQTQQSLDKSVSIQNSCFINTQLEEQFEYLEQDKEESKKQPPQNIDFSVSIEQKFPQLSSSSVQNDFNKNGNGMKSILNQFQSFFSESVTTSQQISNQKTNKNNSIDKNLNESWELLE